jgi:beta-mannanase
MKGALVSILLVGAIAALVALQIEQPWKADTRTVPAWPRPSAPPHVKLGVTTVALARNSFRPWSSGDLQQVNAFEQVARRHTDIVMWFADWAHATDFDARQATDVTSRGSVPEISWEPWDSRGGVDQPRYRLATIVAGAHDAYIRRWAREIAAWGRPVRLRFAHEMNGRWYPWAERANGNLEGEYAAAWRHVHSLFAQAGAHNVQWVWSPVAGHVDPNLYPGADQVDVLAVSGFVADTGAFRQRWRSFERAFGRTLTAVHRLDPAKPVMLSEIGVDAGAADKAAWIRAMFREIGRRRYVRALVWFELRKEADWRITSSPDVQAAFASGLSAVA